MEPFRADKTVLVVVDVQSVFDEWVAEGQRRNNPEAEDRIADLFAHFRRVKAPIIHIRHASLEPQSRLRAELPGHRVKDEAREEPGEPVLIKHVNSSFIGTDLEQRLRAEAIETVVVVGATTNHCVETTARMAGNLGFDTKLVRDATWTFDRRGVEGETFLAEQVHAMTLANLHDEYVEVVTTAEVIELLSIGTGEDGWPRGDRHTAP